MNLFTKRFFIVTSECTRQHSGEPSLVCDVDTASEPLEKLDYVLRQKVAYFCLGATIT